MKKNGIRRALGICAAFALVLSAFTGLISLAAPVNPYIVSPQSAPPEGYNLLLGKTGEYFLSGFEDTVKGTVPAAFTDGKAEGGYVDLTRNDGKAWVIYDLGSEMEIEKILVLSRQLADQEHPEEFYSARYNVRIADTRDGLFEDTACKISYSNVNKEIGHLFTFEEDHFPTGRFIAFEFSKFNFRNDASLRIGELGVYTDAWTVQDQTAIPTGKANLIAGKAHGALKDSSGNAIAADDINAEYHQAGRYTDSGSAGDSIQVTSNVNPCFIYDLGQIYTISELLLLSRDMGADKRDLTTKSYNIRIADTEQGLFEDDACKVAYVNPEQEKLGQLFTFQDGHQPAGRFVAFEIVEFNFKGRNVDSFIRINELGVYTDAWTVQDQTTIPAGKANRIAEKEHGALKDSGGNAIAAGNIDAQYHQAGRYTDGGSAGDSIQVTSNVNPCFIYDLGQPYTISELLLLSRDMGADKRDLTTKSYNIRVADTEQGLFEDSACKVTYVNPEQEKLGQLFTFKDGQQPTGRFVAFEIVEFNFKGRDTDSYIRINELGVYGTPNNYTVTDQTTIPADKTSLIAGKAHLSPKDNHGAALTVTGGTLNANSFTNSQPNDGYSIEFSTLDKSKNVCFIYDLGQPYTISDLLLLSRDTGNKEHTTKSYNIRIANTEQGLFEDGACKVAYINLDREKIGQLFTFKEGQQPTGRFVAFEIIDFSFAARNSDGSRGNSYIRIGELGVYGEPANTYTVQDQPEIPAGKTNLIGGKTYTGIQYSDGAAATSAGGDHEAARYTNGLLNETDSIDVDPKNGTCFVYDLGKRYTVSELLFISRMADGENNITKSYGIRIADTEEELFTDSACKASYVNTDKKKGQLITFGEENQPTGRFVAFEINGYNFGGNNFIRIDELGVYGTEYKEPEKPPVDPEEPEEPATYDCDTYMSLANSFYHRYRKDLKASWVPYLQYEELVQDGEARGVRYNFKDPQPGVGSDENYGQARGAYSEAVSLEGVKLQFDNLTAGRETDSCFTVVLAGLVGTTADNWTATGDQYTRGGVSMNFNYRTGEVTVSVGGGQAAGVDRVIPEETETVIAANDTLKLANLEGKAFTVQVRRISETAYEVIVAVEGKEPLRGTFSDHILSTSSEYSWGIQDFRNVYVGLAGGWDGTKLQTYSLDFIGVTTLPLKEKKVIELIDSIGVVTVDDAADIAKAQELYEGLSEYEKSRVINIDALWNAQNSLAYLQQHEDSIVEDTIAAIDAIGTVSKRSGSAIKEAEELYSRLGDSQKKKVTNADKLSKAIAGYYELVAEDFADDALLYPTADMLRQFSDEELKTYWQDKLTVATTERGGLLFTWKNATRDTRNGVGGIQDAYQDIFYLDGLSFQIANITSDEKNAEGDVGAKLNIQIGNAYEGYGDGRNLSLVLDTIHGEIRAYPGGGLVIKDDALKHPQDRAADRIYVFEIRKNEDGLYRLFVTVGSKNLSGLIPSSTMGTLEADGCFESPSKPSRLRVNLCPWVNNERALKDDSPHSFSAELLSVQDSGKFAFELISDVIALFDTLPDKATTENIEDIQEIYDQYKALPYALRNRITNYDKLARLLMQIHMLNAAENLDWFNEADLPGGTGTNPGGANPGGNDKADAVDTGVTSNAFVFALIGISAAVALMLAGKRRNKRNHDVGEGA